MATKQNLTGNHPPAEEKTIFLPNTWTPSGVGQTGPSSFFPPEIFITMRGNIKRFRLEKCSTSHLLPHRMYMHKPITCYFLYDVDRDVYDGWIFWDVRQNSKWTSVQSFRIRDGRTSNDNVCWTGRTSKPVRDMNQEQERSPHHLLIFLLLHPPHKTWTVGDLGWVQ